MIHTLRTAAFKHGYLVITAAWLYTFSFIVSNYWAYDSSPEKVRHKLEQLLHNKEERFNEIIGDTSLVKSLASDTIHSKEERDLADEDFGLFLYTLNDLGNPILSFWNNNQFYINDKDLQKPDGTYFMNYQNGDFELIKKTIRLNKGAVLFMAVLPVHREYFIQNKYLQSDFEGYPGLDDQYELSTAVDALPVHSLNGKELFRIKLRPEKNYGDYDVATIILRTVAIILLLFFLNALALETVAEKGFKQGFVLLLLSVLALRFVTYYIPFPFDFRQLGLFDPSIYASNSLHPSLGDLLVNVTILFWFVNFYKINAKENFFSYTIDKPVFLYINIASLVIICFLISGIVRSLVLDSKISFDVTNFFSLDIYSIVSFVVLCLMALSLFYIAHILLQPVFTNKTGLYIQLLTVAVTGLIFLSFNIGNPSTIPNIAVLFWLLLFIVLLNVREEDISKPLVKSSFFIFWVMFFASSIAGMVIYQNKVVELEQRKRIADKLALQTDPSGESLLNIAITNFDDKFLTDNFSRLTSDYSNKYIKDSLISSNFSGYLNKYDTRIYTFDSLFHPLYNDDSTSYASIRTILLRQVKKSNISGLYSYESNGQRLTYLYEKDIKSGSGSIAGYLFVIVKPKRYVSEALYPELFKQVQDISSDMNTNYAYAVYSGQKLISSFNDYSFANQLNKKQATTIDEFKQVNKGGYNELWYNAGNGRQVVIVRKNEWLLEAVTLFAYLFCSFLLVILLFYAGNFLLQNRFNWKTIRQSFRLNIRSQINITIIFISVFSFIVIGAATISFFIIRFNKSNEDRLYKSIQVMATEIESKIRYELVFDDGLSENDFGVGSSREKKIIEISEIHNVDVNYYDEAGNLKISTQPYIYNKHLLSSKMNPVAYYELHHDKKKHFVQQEHIGKLYFLSIYIPIIDDQGHTYAYLNIPYLNSQAELNQEISGFLATLINLNAFIFLLAGAIAFLVANRITSSFSLIGDKMKEVSLGKVNEEIVWNKDDEIGVLVNEYNKMVKKLEESAMALARSEREGAWREMARQVAHEIKNPLTPMKLSIQYLQRAIDGDGANVKELSQQVATTLVEQIDQLSKIAGDFSQFANIGNAKIEHFDINEVLHSLINLHRANDTITINWQKEKGVVYDVLADKTQVNRLFTNLIKNAIEASEGKAMPVINIRQSISKDNIVVTISDNGPGIPIELQERIFTPNFTTKSSGTGLGLAICRGIVEKANGKIWFETEQGKGTTFFVQLPLAG